MIGSCCQRLKRRLTNKKTFFFYISSRLVWIFYYIKFDLGRGRPMFIWVHRNFFSHGFRIYSGFFGWVWSNKLSNYVDSLYFVKNSKWSDLASVIGESSHFNYPMITYGINHAFTLYWTKHLRESYCANSRKFSLSRPPNSLSRSLPPSLKLNANA